ncbi:MAG TPA: VWA domain-containing protein [Steroidobacteraceae bacterium]
MARKKTETFSMSFLDVISCGFGAVVLFYTIMASQAGMTRTNEHMILQANANRLDKEVMEGRAHLAELRNALESTEDKTVQASGLSRAALERMKLTEEELAKYSNDTVAQRESLERLKADLQQLEEGNRRLKERAKPAAGVPVKSVDDQQQLATLRVSGKRVLMLVDASASMLDETLVNVIRLRNMPPERRIQSAKWQQAVNTVEWITARLAQDTQFQIYAFDTGTRPVVEGTAGRWLSVREAGQVEGAIAALRRTAPTGGTSLQNAFAVIKQLNPAPDNVILVTDGLPTQGEKPPLMRTLVTEEQREDLMQDAIKALPPSPPQINVVLLAMEGDPSAPIYFWRLARATGGSFLNPAEDWP